MLCDSHICAGTQEDEPAAGSAHDRQASQKCVDIIQATVPAYQALAALRLTQAIAALPDDRPAAELAAALLAARQHAYGEALCMFCREVVTPAAIAHGLHPVYHLKKLVRPEMQSEMYDPVRHFFCSKSATDRQI